MRVFPFFGSRQIAKNSMVKKVFALMGFVILIGSSLKAQSSYQSGYVVTINSDTIRCYILNDIDANLAESIMFKEELNKTAVSEYTTKDILGFRFDSGREFTRFEPIQDLQTDKPSHYIFAKSLIKGKIDLYVWRHDKLSSKDFFILNQDNQRKAQLSKPIKIEVKKDGKTFSKKDQRYQHLLNYVKHINPEEDDKYKKIGFVEKSIRKDISSYNSNFEQEYPQVEYNEPKDYHYDVLVGLPFKLIPEETQFRVGIYRNKTYTDKTSRFSTFSGIIYNHWDSGEKESDLDISYSNGSKNYKSQLLNIIPIGLKFQSKAKKVIPYCYLGVGAMLLVHSNYVTEDYELSGTEKQYYPLPTINLGTGLKIKVNSNFLLAEITPTYSGVFFNLGYSF